jgi:2-C-methyl-D-erythritol 4-phosphate cytidylyltransferase
MKKFAVIVAGGSGSRMGTEIPKQFLKLHGKPVLMYTIEVFRDFDADSEIIVVLPEHQIDFWKALCKRHSFDIKHQIVCGGKTRFHSVQNGLSKINDNGIVFIHDGVRPLVSPETLKRCADIAGKTGNAIPVLPINESLRKVDGQSNISVDRNQYFAVQTPQTFRSEQILKAFQQEYDPLFTDDASVAEKAGFEIHLVEGNRENIKITTPVDLIVSESILSKSES